MSSMSTLSVGTRFQRRPSFWKTPIPSNNTKSPGTKRKYTQIGGGAAPSDDPSNPSKRRRILSDEEVITLAKEGRFNPSSIILAVEDETGFCWFKRIETNPSSKSTAKIQNSIHSESEGALRELSKTELSQRAEAKTKSNTKSNSNSNDENTVHRDSTKNKNKPSKAMVKAAKMRRFTAPPQVLQSIVEQKEMNGEDVVMEQKERKKKRKKKRVKRQKKVICYETKREIVRKKVHRKKRVLRKKTIRSQTIRITDVWAETAVPDFPPPEMSLSVRQWLREQDGYSPLAAVRDVELSLLDGFVQPLMKCYGDKGTLSFITRAVFQYLMELRADIDAMVQAVNCEVVRVPVTLALTANVEPSEAPKGGDDGKEKEEEPPQSILTVDKEVNLDDEATFYEEQYLMLQQFSQRLYGEMEFTKRIQNELKDAESLKAVFDFDLNLEAESDAVRGDNANAVSVSAVGGDEQFVERMASEIDGLWSDYTADLHAIAFEQEQFEAALERREKEEAELAKLYVRDDEEREREEQWVLAAEDTICGDRMVFSNFVASNKGNDFTEDDTIHCGNYLKADSMSVFTEDREPQFEEP